MHPVVPEMSEKAPGDLSPVGVGFAEHLVCLRVYDGSVAVVDIGPGQYEVVYLAYLVAQQVQLEPHLPVVRECPREQMTPLPAHA